MATIFGTVCLLLCILGCFGTEERHSDESADEAYLDFVDKVLSSAMKIEASPYLKKLYTERKENVQRAEAQTPEIIYHCDPKTLTRSTSIPTSVHMLRPSDVQVVAAFGDSITACNGCGARNLVELAIEKRGESWCAGSDRSMEEGFITIPNLLNEFGAETAGYSTCASVQYSKPAWFNVARPGARCDHMPAQAVGLVDLMKADQHIDFENDWKVITLFIGGNDLCRYCRRPDAHNPQAYRRDIEEAVDTLKANVPRALVQLVTMFDLTPIHQLSRNYLCTFMQYTFCECGLNATYRAELQEVQMGYYTELLDLANQPKYADTDDFTVVLQHHMRDVKPYYDEELGEWKTSFLSVDCFHPNTIGHRGLASWLWNAMLWPVGQKPYDNDVSVNHFEICCPTEDYPYIFTNENSKGIAQNPWTESNPRVCWQPGTTRKVARSLRGVKRVAVDLDDSAAHTRELLEEPHPEMDGRATFVWSVFGVMVLSVVVIGVVAAMRKRRHHSRKSEEKATQILQFENSAWENEAFKF